MKELTAFLKKEAERWKDAKQEVKPMRKKKPGK